MRQDVRARPKLAINLTVQQWQHIHRALEWYQLSEVEKTPKAESKRTEELLDIIDEALQSK